MLPMLATPATHPGQIPEGSDWVYEVKWDGMRVITESRGGRLRMVSRRGNAVTTAFPELATDQLPDGIVLDGEVVAMAEGKPSFAALAGRIHVRDLRRSAKLAAVNPVTYLVFDILRLGGHDLTGLPWDKRRETLESLQLGAVSPRWQVPPIYDDGALLLEITRSQGLEGVVAKRRYSRYYPGRRSRDWIKTAHRSTLTCAVVGWIPQTDNDSLLGAVWMGLPDGDGRWRTLGRCGAGLAGAEGNRLLMLVAGHPRARTVYADLPDDPDIRRARWVEPRVLIEVRYLGTDDSGRLRQPVYLGVRTDLGPDDLIGTSGGDRAGADEPDLDLDEADLDEADAEGGTR